MSARFARFHSRYAPTAKIPIPAVVEVRGEIYMPLAEFERLNRTVVEAGEEPFANPRNATAGTLKQLDPRIVAERRLQIVAHGRGEILPLPLGEGRGEGAFTTHSEFLTALAAWGIPTNPLTQKCATIDAVWKMIEEFGATRGKLPYGVDGVVVRVDRIDLQEQLGYTSKFPRWCIAYKYAAEQAETKLISVDWQVGKTGKLTPRATMEPVFVAGTTVQHATLHNLGEIRRKDIRVGDFVVIEKAGEIIPQVVRVLLDKRTPHVTPIVPPDKCPECDGEVEIDLKMRDGGEVETSRFCINPECPAQFRERLIHFAGRRQMNIDGLGEEIIDQLLKANLVNHFADLFLLNEDQLANLQHTSKTRAGKEVPVRLGEKKARQILSSLEKSKSRGLAVVIAALGIRHIGSETGRVIAANVSGIDELLVDSEEQVREAVSESNSPSKLAAIKKISATFHESLHSSEGQMLIKKAKASGEVASLRNDLRAFLDILPKGRKWGTMKWGKAGGGRKDQLLEGFETLNELVSASVEEIAKCFDGEVVGKSLYDFLHSPTGKDTIERLKKVGVGMDSTSMKSVATNSPISGKSFVVTGTLQNYSREHVHDLIRSHGGKPSSSVSKSTDYLVVGENPGSKLDKANSLGVKVINEDELSTLLKSSTHEAL